MNLGNLNCLDNSKVIKLIDLIRKSTLIKTSAIYIGANLINAAIPFLLLPYLTMILSQEDYGIVTMFTTVMVFVIPFISINTSAAISRIFFKKDIDLSEYIGNSLCIVVFCYILTTILFLIFGNQIVLNTGIPRQWILLIPLTALSTSINSIVLILWQVRQKAFFFGIFKILLTATNLGFTFLFIYYAKVKWHGRVEGIILSNIVFSIIGYLLLWKRDDIKFKLNKEYIKHIFQFGGGLIPHTIGIALIMLSNRFFLTRMISINEAGLYGVATQLASAIFFLTVSFNNAFIPWLYKKLTLADNKIKRYIVKLTYIYFVALIFIGAAFYILLPIIFDVFIDPNFSSAIKYCSWIIVGFIFQGMYFMVTNYISYAEKTYVQAIITISIGCISLIINYVFIYRLGAIGAAVSFCFSYFLFFIVTWFFSNRIYSMPWSISHFFKYNRLNN